jgi:predicted ArsR family transcriptional regulator
MRAFERGLSAISALEEHLRRSMYLYIRSQTHPVSRDEAASRVGISRKLAAFHLDRLVERGLLTASYGHPPDRPKDRAGRTSKLYEPTDLAIEINLPERRYDLLAQTLAEAVTSGGAEAVACEVARRKGAALARDAAGSREEATETAVKLLERHGYEPVREGKTVWLRNCPFRAVATQCPELICYMNLAFVQGLLSGLDPSGADAILDPAPGRCCVSLAGKPQ